MSKDKKNSGIINGMFWSFSERITAQFITTLVTIILARILSPESFGIISMVTIFITISNVFVTSGFGNSVVQKKDPKDIDYNTAFWLSLIISLFLYLVLFFCAPIISSFYKMGNLCSVIRVMGLRLPIAALNNLQQAYLRKKMQFKKFFIATLFGTMISAVIGIVLALMNFEVWALVFQYLSNVIIDTVVLCFVCGWNPRFEFSKSSALSIFKFGWKVLFTDLSSTLVNDFRSLIIGKVFGSSDLAFYDQGKKYPAFVVNNVNASINKVMLPAYSAEQNNISKAKKILSKSISIGMFILAPIMIGFAVVSNNFVSVVLTEKWLPAIPFIQIFCISYLTRPLEESCHQALLGIGKSGSVLIIMIIIESMDLITAIIGAFVFRNTMIIAYGLILSTIISIISFVVACKKFLGYSLKDFYHDVIPSISLSVLMGIIVVLVGKLNFNKLIVLVLQVLVGIFVYYGLIVLTKNESYFYIKNKIISLLKKESKKSK